MNRYPECDEGELTHLRSCLVKNLHLSRLLTRRFGAALAREFVRDASEAHRRAIESFVAGVDTTSGLSMLEAPLLTPRGPTARAGASSRRQL